MEQLVGRLVKQGELKSSAIRDLGEICLVLAVRSNEREIREKVCHSRGWSGLRAGFL